MAKILRYVEDVSKIDGKSFIIEIESVEFIDDNSVTKSFKINSVVPVSTERCYELDNNVDWDKRNFHLLVCPEGLELR